MSTLSEAKKLLTSERESKVNYKAIAGVVIGGLILWFAVNFLATMRAPFDLDTVRAMPTATAPAAEPSPTMAVIAAPEDPRTTSTPLPTPIIVYNERVVEIPIEVTREVAYYVPGPEIEVTRVVTVTVADPTPTVVPLAGGTVEICARVEGAKSLYIGQAGVVSGECRTFAFGVGQTAIMVQIDR